MAGTNGSLFDNPSPELTRCYVDAYQSHYKRLCAYVYQFVRDHSTAEDIVQDCFVKLWARRQSIDFSYGLTNLLYTMARHATYDHLKKSKTISEPDESLELMAKNNFVNEMIYSETLVEIYRIAQELPEKCSDIFKRLFIYGRNHAEVASELGITPSTVRTQKAKALSFIKLHLHRLMSFICFI